VCISKITCAAERRIPRWGGEVGAQKHSIEKREHDQIINLGEKKDAPAAAALGAICDLCYHNAARAIARIAHFLDLEEEAFEEIFTGSSSHLGDAPGFRPR